MTENLCPTAPGNSAEARALQEFLTDHTHLLFSSPAGRSYWVLELFLQLSVHPCSKGPILAFLLLRTLQHSKSLASSQLAVHTHEASNQAERFRRRPRTQTCDVGYPSTPQSWPPPKYIFHFHLLQTFQSLLNTHVTSTCSLGTPCHLPDPTLPLSR